MNHSYSSLLARWLPHPLAALGLLLASAGAAQAQTTFMYTAPGGPQTYQVPAGVTSLQVVANGASGVNIAGQNPIQGGR